MAATGCFALVALWPYDPAGERTLTTLNRVGIVGAYSSFYLYRWLGFGAIVLAAILLLWGGALFLGRFSRRLRWLTAATVAAAWLSLTLLGIAAAWRGIDASVRAGRVGNLSAALLTDTVGLAGAVLACFFALAVLVVVVFRISLADRVEAGVELGVAGGRRVRENLDALGDRVAEWREARGSEAQGDDWEDDDWEDDDESEYDEAEDLDLEDEGPSEAEDSETDSSGGSEEEARRRSAAGDPVGTNGPAPESFQPPIDLLDAPVDVDSRRSGDDLDELGELVIAKLASFGVEGEVVGIHSGPVLTRFEIKPAAGVKVNRISNLSDDLALAMRAQRIRIVAPIPGRGAVGIEVPNPEPRVVTQREILESPAWSQSKARLPLALGREIAGSPIVTDLARMPHLLIAGATGSGKSVCINSIVTSLLYRYGPEEVRLIMIDPKMLELITYNGIPHLLHPVVVEHKHAAKALKWTVAEMERRYRLLAANGVRSLDDFNARVQAGEELKGLDDDPPGKLPFIVVLIDELADLMLTVQNEIEEPLARLAQMARAVGIHLVLATQRPSVNVITGVIKANFPSRISFQVSSKIDSRTVLDSNGAEQLLGRGDMLYLPADRAEAVRVQGAYVSTDETARIVEFLRAAGAALDAEEVAPQIDIIAEASELEMAALDERDELFLAAARVVVEYDQGSTSLLQRRLKVGYSRAARILDQLERANIVGPPEGTRPRQVLIGMHDLEPLERDSL